MANIIQLIESNNELSLADSGAKIVCGNSNYSLLFTLSDSWQACKNKVAVFFVGGQRKVVAIGEDNTCKVPVMQNAPSVFVSLTSGEGEEMLTTTTAKIELVETMVVGDFSEFDYLKNNLTELLSAVNKIENGKLYVESAKQAEIAKNVSNPNLIINGDFKVNQRGKNQYSGAGIYTVDRWRLHSTGTLNVNSDGTVTYTIGTSNWSGLNYYIEKPSLLSNKTFTFSLKGSSTAGVWLSVYHKGSSLGGVYTRDSGDFYLTSTITFGEILDSDNLTIRITTRNTDMPAGVTSNSVTLEFVKLEVGSYATPLSPRPYAEELAVCQRYYYRLENKSSSTTLLIGTLFFGQANYSWGYISLPSSLRTTPTISYSNLSDLTVTTGSGGTPVQISSLTITNNSYNNLRTYCIAEGITAGSVLALQLNAGATYVEFDAEIYW